jgi:hypothetical protein
MMTKERVQRSGSFIGSKNGTSFVVVFVLLWIHRLSHLHFPSVSITTTPRSSKFLDPSSQMERNDPLFHPLHSFGCKGTLVVHPSARVAYCRTFALRLFSANLILQTIIMFYIVTAGGESLQWVPLASFVLASSTATLSSNAPVVRRRFQATHRLFDGNALQQQQQSFSSIELTYYQTFWSQALLLLRYCIIKVKGTNPLSFMVIFRLCIFLVFKSCSRLESVLRFLDSSMPFTAVM